jgi:NTP pyrophosphatase (non-canonical NTP hydrolase)
MNFNEYQDATARTWKFGTEHTEAIKYLTMGLTGEAGEVAEWSKKTLYHGKPPGEGIVGELGDVLWYVARLAAETGYSLQQVAEMNIEKLRVRHLEKASSS